MGLWLSKIQTKRENDQILTTLADRLNDESLDKVNILLVGPSGAGKSAFINNCFSAIDNHRLTIAPTRVARGISQRIFPYYLDVTGARSKVVLLDSKGYYFGVTNKHVDQTITWEHQFVHLIPDDVYNKPDYKHPAEINTLGPKTASVILFVFSQEWVSKFKDILADKTMEDQIEKMKTTRDNVRRAGIPAFVLLTHIDEVDPKIEEDILGYRSTDLDEMTKYLKNLFDIPNIFQVWNIPDSRPDIDAFQRCHILRILNQIIVNALKSHKNYQHMRENMEKNKEK